MTSKIEHYLLTLDLAPLPVRVHGYVITDKPNYVEQIANVMVDRAEKLLPDFRFVPIMLQTTLAGKGSEAAIKLVQSIVNDISDETRKTLAEATNQHVTVWGMATDDPRDEPLMALH